MIRKTISNFEIKPLRPKDPDIKYFGEEPDFTKEDPKLNIGKAFTWYHRFYTKKDGKEFLSQYLSHTGKTQESKTILKVPDSDFVVTYCWLSRMMLRGLELSPEHKTKFDDEVSRLLSLVNIDAPEVVDTKAPKVNIQEIMKERRAKPPVSLRACLINISLRVVNQIIVLGPSMKSLRKMYCLSMYHSSKNLGYLS